MNQRQIPLFKVFMAPEVGDKVQEILYSGYIGQGKKVEEFEKQLQNHFNTNRILTTNSATSAEHLALMLLKPVSKSFTYDGLGELISGWPGLNPGDTFLCSPMTCTASNWPIPLSGYKIKWVDIDSYTLNMDLNDLARKISPETKGIMLPLWGGMPVNFRRVKEIQDNAAKMYGFRPVVIIDAAHAMDSKFDGLHVSSFGHITTYSFQAIKHVTSVDGGAIVLPHQELYDRAKKLRWYGIRRDDVRKDFRCENNIDEIGTKLHMNDVNATIGIENFKRVDEITLIHRTNAAFYNRELIGVEGVSLTLKHPLADPSYWIYTIFVERRNDFMRMMEDAGIHVSRVHERNDKHSAVAQFRSQLPNLEDVVDRMICIPVHHGVSPEDREYIVEKIKKGW